MNIKNSLYIVLATVIAIILLLVLFGVWPLWTQINSNSQERLSIKNQEAALTQQNTTIEDFKKAYPSYQPNLTSMDQSFVDPQDPVNFITFLENTASAMGIKIKISLVSTDPQESGQTIEFHVTCSDNFTKIEPFIENVEYGPYSIEIQNMTMKNSDEPTDKTYPSGNVDADFIIKTLAKQ